MSSKQQISVPQAASWLIRLAAHPKLSDNLSRDAVAFSAWYAAAHELIDWPEEVKTIQTQFTEHLCQQLGIPLIAKTASDLMSKWVGDNEKNIAAPSKKRQRKTGLCSSMRPIAFYRAVNMRVQVGK